MHPLPIGLLNVDDTLTHIGTLKITKFDSLISELHMTLVSKSRIYIPLCQLILLSLIIPILEVNV